MLFCSLLQILIIGVAFLRCLAEGRRRISTVVIFPRILWFLLVIIMPRYNSLPSSAVWQDKRRIDFGKSFRVTCIDILPIDCWRLTVNEQRDMLQAPGRTRLNTNNFISSLRSLNYFPLHLPCPRTTQTLTGRSWPQISMISLSSSPQKRRSPSLQARIGGSESCLLAW